MGFGESVESKLNNKNVVSFANPTSLTHYRLVKNPEKHKTLNLAEHYFRCGLEIIQQIGNEHFFHPLNRSLLALICAQKGEWEEALKIAKEALGAALAQGGVISPICELLLSPILLENGVQKQSMEDLLNVVDLSKRTGLKAQEKKGVLFRLQMFGPVRVFYAGEEIEVSQWRTVKSRHLLAYLAHQNKPVSTDQIIEDLWPYIEPDKALSLFHTTLYYLRRLLQQFTNEELIIRGSKRYQLRPEKVLIDRYQFEDIALIASEKQITAAMAKRLEAAVLLYSGDYLDDLDYQWVMPVQEKLRSLYIDIRQKLAVYYLENKMPNKALLHLQQLMALNPYSETVLKLLLTAYAEKGDQSAIIQQYTTFTRNIQNELGLRPSSEMERFFTILSEKN